MKILLLDQKKLTRKSRAGLSKWPDDPEETQGYVVATRNGTIDLLAQDYVSLTELPQELAGLQVLGTFHSHPHGCRKDRCFHQPPSIKDLTSFRELSMGPLNLPVHLIITKQGILFVKTHRSNKKRWRAMMKELEALQNKNARPEETEPLWYGIAHRYPDVMSVTVLKKKLDR